MPQKPLSRFQHQIIRAIAAGNPAAAQVSQVLKCRNSRVLRSAIILARRGVLAMEITSEHTRLVLLEPEEEDGDA